MRSIVLLWVNCVLFRLLIDAIHTCKQSWDFLMRFFHRLKTRFPLGTNNRMILKHFVCVGFQLRINSFFIDTVPKLKLSSGADLEHHFGKRHLKILKISDFIFIFFFLLARSYVPKFGKKHHYSNFSPFLKEKFPSSPCIYHWLRIAIFQYTEQ